MLVGLYVLPRRFKESMTRSDTKKIVFIFFLDVECPALQYGERSVLATADVKKKKVKLSL
jgi:hypothetical protein